MSETLRSPRQASTIYGMDTTNIPRKKSLFYARFRRTDNGQASVGGGWSDNFSFVLKQIGRPAETPIIEEMNQYNKKRQIITGMKREPINMVFYDVVDNTLHKMWDEYTRYYYGDYNQEDEVNFDYDATLPVSDGTRWARDNGSGFGYRPRALDSNTPYVNQAAMDLNSSNFFDAIEIYQVFGGYFVQTDLVNPKITAFTPDELDYEQTTISTVSITIAYEAILRRNGGKAIPISENSFVSQAFNDQFNGDVLDVTSGSRTELTSALQTTLNIDTSSNFYKDFFSRSFSNTTVALSNIPASTTKVNFGNYDFGNLNLSSMTPSSYSSAVNQTLISGDETFAGLANGSSKGINSSVLDVATSSVTSAAKNSTGSNFLKNVVVAGVVGSGVLNKTSPSAAAVVRSLSYGATTTQAIQNGVRSTSQGQKALSLESQTIAIINATKSLRSQIGKKT